MKMLFARFCRPGLLAGLLAVLLANLAPQAWAQKAMIYGTDAVSSPPAVSLPTGTEAWFTQGNGTSVRGTQVPAYWVNKVGGELSNAIAGSGQTLSMATYNQLSYALHGRLLRIDVITSNTSFTPPVGTLSMEIEIVGAGGGGGGAPATDSAHVSVGSGGGSGPYTKFQLILAGGPFSVVIGAGGAGGTMNGSAGGTTSFGPYVTCPGGNGGGGAIYPTGSGGQTGAGGSAAQCTYIGGTLGQIEVNAGGTPGPNGIYFSNAVASGQGGSGFYGGGANNTNNSNGSPGAGVGSGGSGAGCPPSCAGYIGGTGSNGYVIVHSFS